MADEFPWLRLYTKITRDPRLRRKPVSYRWTWIACLVIARKSPRPGYLIVDNEPATDEDIADEAAIPVKDVKAAMKWLQQERGDEAPFVDVAEGLRHVEGWDDKQFSSDTSKDRVKRYRQRRRNVTGNVTGNVTEAVTVTADGTRYRDTELQKGREVPVSPSLTGTDSDKPLSLSGVDEGVLGYWVGKAGRDPSKSDANSLRSLCKNFAPHVVATAIGQAVMQGSPPDNFALITTIAKSEARQ